MRRHSKREEGNTAACCSARTPRLPLHRLSLTQNTNFVPNFSVLCDDCSQSECGQIALISLNLHKRSIPLRRSDGWPAPGFTPPYRSIAR